MMWSLSQRSHSNNNCGYRRTRRDGKRKKERDYGETEGEQDQTRKEEEEEGGKMRGEGVGRSLLSPRIMGRLWSSASRSSGNSS